MADVRPEAEELYSKGLPRLAIGMSEGAPSECVDGVSWELGVDVGHSITSRTKIALESTVPLTVAPPPVLRFVVISLSDTCAHVCTAGGRAS